MNQPEALLRSRLPSHQHLPSHRLRLPAWNSTSSSDPSLKGWPRHVWSQCGCRSAFQSMRVREISWHIGYTNKFRFISAGPVSYYPPKIYGGQKWRVLPCLGFLPTTQNGASLNNKSIVAELLSRLQRETTGELDAPAWQTSPCENLSDPATRPL